MWKARRGIENRKRIVRESQESFTGAMDIRVDGEWAQMHYMDADAKTGMDMDAKTGMDTVVREEAFMAMEDIGKRWKAAMNCRLFWEDAATISITAHQKAEDRAEY